VIATLPVGYADGYARSLSNKASVLIRGRRAPVVGRVCMDMTMVDVTEVPGAAIGDEAVLLGRQGSERIGAEELADLEGTIPYEVLCAVGARVPRETVGG
jgi:alanine racemase